MATAAPLTREELVTLVRKSGLVEPERLDPFLQSPENADLPQDRPRKLARRLVRAGLLTDFQAMQLLEGKYRGFNLGRFRVLEQLGSDGLYNGYLCADASAHRLVEVFVLLGLPGEGPASLARFYPEARFAARLTHSHLASQHQFERDGTSDFLVRPHIDGSHLRRIIRKHGPLAVARAAHYLRQAATGLQYIHEVGLVHGDLHPRNLVLDRQGVLKILNLGLGRFFQDQRRAAGDKLEPVEAAGFAAFQAPELTTPESPVDIRADIYSLGAIFRFLLTGNLPPVHREIEPLRTLRPEVPEELAVIVAKMMARDPVLRYATPSEVIDALAPWTQTPIAPPSASEMPDFSPAVRNNLVPDPPKPGSETVSASVTQPVPTLPIPQHNLVLTPEKAPPLPEVKEKPQPSFGAKAPQSPNSVQQVLAKVKTAVLPPPPPASVPEAPGISAAREVEDDDEEDMLLDISPQTEIAPSSRPGTSSDSEADLFLSSPLSDSEADFSLSGLSEESAEEIDLNRLGAEEDEETTRIAAGPSFPLRSDPPEDRAPRGPSMKKKDVSVSAKAAAEESEAASLRVREPRPVPAEADNGTPLDMGGTETLPEMPTRERKKSSTPRVIAPVIRSGSMAKLPDQDKAKKKKAPGESANLGKAFILLVLAVAAMVPICISMKDLIRLAFSSDEKPKPVIDDAPAPDPQPKNRGLEGALDPVNPNLIHGWAWNKNDPDKPIRVDIYDGSTRLAMVNANIYRQDLQSGGLGNGKHVFGYKLPAQLQDGQEHTIRVKFSGTEIDLVGSPQTVALKTP